MIKSWGDNLWLHPISPSQLNKACLDTREIQEVLSWKCLKLSIFIRLPSYQSLKCLIAPHNQNLMSTSEEQFFWCQYSLCIMPKCQGELLFNVSKQTYTWGWDLEQALYFWHSFSSLLGDNRSCPALKNCHSQILVLMSVTQARREEKKKTPVNYHIGQNKTLWSLQQGLLYPSTNHVCWRAAEATNEQANQQ